MMNTPLPQLTLRLGSVAISVILVLSQLTAAANTDDAQIQKQQKQTAGRKVQPLSQIQIDLREYLLTMNNETLAAAAKRKAEIKENGVVLIENGNKKFDVPENPVARMIPDRRFSLWSELTLLERAYAEKILGYNEATWETGWRNTVETHAYPALDANKKIALGQLGISADQWDCHVNHYYGYDWDALTELGVVTYFAQLGWNRESWNGSNGTDPEIENMTWDELSEKQQMLVNEICYFKETWDELPMKFWLFQWRLVNDATRESSSTEGRAMSSV